jgi:membrane protease YdiL (CAAX protease family)
MNKRAEQASGFQIAFLVFAVVVLSIPLTKYSGPWSEVESTALGRAFMFGIAAAVLCGFAEIRRASIKLLAAPIDRAHRTEVLLILFLHLLTPFALCGGLVLEAWIKGGPSWLATQMGYVAMRATPEAAEHSMVALIMGIPVGCFVGPVIEELIFRGFLYKAWERQFGGFVSMFLTSLAFALYHPFFTAAFTASVIYISLYRRTGSLQAVILVHCTYNVAVMYTLLGKFVFRPVDEDMSQLLSWWPQLACLAAIAFLVPTYVWMARRSAHGGS